ncbi:alpha/beta-hydrolase [Mytilinidion resinicola]|uniref:Alpha/beta-hydrolase n=1 Tax=Mytilinidion resinicola TaxID=574789 RepID=A0A6A6YV63_9PEZI|nr:alpha/beta-hydrolase [Mytilinidion resinicola]KAF2811884.1 alpha/beta-hydrolase [Mytilinidion resinicola]
MREREARDSTPAFRSTSRGIKPLTLSHSLLSAYSNPKISQKPYHVQKTVDNPDTFPFHKSVSALWEQKWRQPASMGIYPFVDAQVSDFDPIFAALKTSSNDNPTILSDPDAYATPFFPIASSLVARARTLEQSGDTPAARDLYLRAAAVYCTARFPINRSPLSQKAWEAGKAAYMAASPCLSPPNTEVEIPFSHASPAAGESAAAPIPAYLRLPAGEPPSEGWPLTLFICGLHAYRTDHTPRTTAHVRRGCAVLSVEIPGTGDSPASRGDPAEAERLWSSVFEWIAGNAEKYSFDSGKVVARGVSTGGYYAMRIAHTHADKLLAVEWIRAQNHMEYPFALADVLAWKFGYGSVEAYVEGELRKRFSLVENGVFEMESARMLLINGMEDSIFPIEDSEVALRFGRVKEARWVEGRGHMGNPGAEETLLGWIDEVGGGK